MLLYLLNINSCHLPRCQHQQPHGSVEVFPGWRSTRVSNSPTRNKSFTRLSVFAGQRLGASLEVACEGVLLMKQSGYLVSMAVSQLRFRSDCAIVHKFRVMERRTSLSIVSRWRCALQCRGGQVSGGRAAKRITSRGRGKKQTRGEKQLSGKVKVNKKQRVDRGVVL